MATEGANVMVGTRRLRSVFCSAIAGAAALTFASVVSGQDAVRVTVANITELEYPLVQAVVNIEDTTATTPGSLTKDSFVATVDGQPAAVTEAELASSQTIPLDVLMLMDTSGSTEGEGLAQAKAAAISFIRGLAPEDRVAVMRFANSVTLQQDYTTDKETAIAAINSLTSSGQTETYKATDAAIRQAATSTSLRRAMIMLTDGAADAIVTGITAQDALTTASLSGVPVFTIAQGAAIEDSSFLIELANATNGQYLEAPGSGDLQGVYASIGRILQNQYLVTIDAAAATGKPSSTIDLQVNAGGRTGSATAPFVPGPGFVAPNVVVTGLSAGESITEPRDVTVTAGGTQPITKAAFYVDDVNVFETTEAPFTYTYDPDKFGESSHTLRVAVTVGDQIIDGDGVSFTSVPAVPVVVDDPASATDGGGLPILPLAAIVAVVALIGIGYAVIQRIRTTSGPTLAMVSPDQRVTPWTGQHRTISRGTPAAEDEVGVEPDAVGAPTVQDIGEALGVLISRSGSDAGSLYPVGGKPVSLGNGDTCAVHIDDASLASEEARLWIRKGTLMYHRMTRLTTIAFEGAPGGWQMLEPGESFSIGGHTFEFKLLPEGVPTEEALAELRPAPTPISSPTQAEDVPNVLREKPEPPQVPLVLPQPGTASEDRPRRLTEMMPRDMGFGHQNVDSPDERAS